MWKLLAYAKPYWKIAALAPLLMLLEVITDLTQPILMARIVDQGVANGDLPYVWRTGLTMLGVALIGIVSAFSATVAASYVSQSFGADLRQGLFAKVQAFSFANLDQFKSSSLITRLTNDVSQVQHMVQMGQRMMVRAPLLSFGGMFMAVAINARLSMILLIVIPVLALALFFLIKKGFPLFILVQERLDGVNRVLRENLAGVRVVKAFVRKDFEENRFAESNTDYMQTSLRAARLMALAMPLIMLIMNFSIVAVLWFGGMQVNRGGMQVGQVIAFISYMTQILFSLMMFAFVFVMISRAKASGDRIQEVLAADIDICDAKEPAHQDIELAEADSSVRFQSVSFRYPGSEAEPVLHDIDISINPGETTGILGGTGAGKTSLVHLIPRLYDVCHGQVLVGGVDVRQWPLKILRRKIGVVLQESVLFTGTIAENIRWGNGQATLEEVKEAATLAQADDFITSFPNGYETVVGQRGVTLSGGQKQRLAIARALLKKPSILILDDSTSAIDAGTEARLQQALEFYQQTLTVFIVAQRIASVIDADRIIVLNHGRIEDMGTHSELMKTSKLYQSIYHSQINGEVAV